MSSNVKSASDVIIVLTTMPDDPRAETIAATLIEERLTACVNILPPMTSVYRWNGQVHRDPERQLICKTTRGSLEALQARLIALHPYELPEVLVLEVSDGSAGYLQWVREAARPSTGAGG